LAISASINGSAELTVKIGKEISEVRTFKRTVVASFAAKHRAATDIFDTVHNSEACLQEIDTLVSKCQAFNMLGLTLEVFVTRNYL
jgi:hypothetical protein